MTEEINNINTDMKELFVNSNYDKIIEILNTLDDSDALEITLSNYDIIKKYFDSEKYNLLFQFIKFVAYTSFVCEYSAKRGLIDENAYKTMYDMFETIYSRIKEEQN